MKLIIFETYDKKHYESRQEESGKLPSSINLGSQVSAIVTQVHRNGSLSSS